MRKKISEKVKNIVDDNLLVVAYFICAVLIEMTAVFFVEGTPFLSKPFLALGVLVFICGIVLLVKNQIARTIVCTCLLALQAILDLIFAVVYTMTDQYFDLGMLQLRNDAFGILENLPVDFVTFYTGLFFCITFLVFGLRFAHRNKRSPGKRKSLFFKVGLMLAGLATLTSSFVVYFPREAENKYDNMLDGKKDSVYASYGMIGNLLGEVGKSIFQETTPLAGEDINNYVYARASQKTDYFGVCKGQNVIVILAESLEWYTFLQGENTYGGLEEEYPYVLKNSEGEPISKADLRFMFPNLTEYYEQSVVMTNFHSREKTDIAETTSILGSYPTGEYVNYEYAENTIPHTLPNILKMEDENIQVRSFHNGYKTFYNRDQVHPSFGFEGENDAFYGSPVDMYDMEELSNEQGGGVFKNYGFWQERNLDSEMVEVSKDLMFPTDKRFYTYITTITMHGMYYDRENLSKENNDKLKLQLERLEQYKPKDESSPYYEYESNLYYYMTTGLEFDYMLGCMKKDLQAKGLWDNTVIALFGDHNAYYQEMSNYVKGIPNDYNKAKDRKYTDLYNVPFIIRSTVLTEKIKELRGSSIVDKFTCTADIVPTLLDLLGIRYYSNLYYGHSVFAKEQSVLYSRAYDVFIGDGILRRSVRGDLYTYGGRTESGEYSVRATVLDFEDEGCVLVEKIKYCDYIFRQDHFGEIRNLKKFVANMKELNGW